jgi:hypothetical protein
MLLPPVCKSLENLVVYVAPARGFKRSPFHGSRGDLHPVVVERMRGVLTGPIKARPFVDSTGLRLLEDARTVAASTDLSAVTLLELGPTRTAVMTWTGSRTQRTLQAMLFARGAVAIDEVVGLVIELPPEECSKHFSSIAAGNDDPLKIARHMYRGRHDKYATRGAAAAIDWRPVAIHCATKS